MPACGSGVGAIRGVCSNKEANANRGDMCSPAGHEISRSPLGHSLSIDVFRLDVSVRHLDGALYAAEQAGSVLDRERTALERDAPGIVLDAGIGEHAPDRLGLT